MVIIWLANTLQTIGTTEKLAWELPMFLKTDDIDFYYEEENENNANSL